MAVARGNLLQTEDAQQHLDITSSTPENDTAFHSFINAISATIRGQIKRPVKETSGTEYLNGLGTMGLNLVNYPPITITSVHDDSGRLYADASEITEDTDFWVDYDAGILHKFQSPFGDGIRNVKVVYSYGPKPYEVITGISSACEFSEDSVTRTATIAEGLYSASEFATVLQTALNAAAGDDITYTVAYSETGERFTITESGATTGFAFNCSTHSQTKLLCRAMGFFTTSDQTEATSQTSDEPSAGVDLEIKEVAMLLLTYHQKLIDKDWLGVKAERRADAFMVMQMQDIPPYVQERLAAIRDPMPKVLDY